MGHYVDDCQMKSFILETVCFFVKSCENEDQPGCNQGNEILVLRNKEVVSKIERGIHTFDECFTTASDTTFEFHAGGTDGVSCTEGGVSP